MKIAYSVYAMIILAAASVAAGPVPVLVSPGSTETTEQVASTCPTFSWGGAADTSTYELQVYEVSVDGALGKRVIQERLLGVARAWTPPVRHCLNRAGIYAWMIGAVNEGRVTWSEPALFQVAPGPTEQELQEALLVVRKYLGATALDDAADIETETPRTEAPGEKSRTSERPTPAKGGGSSLFNVSGTLEAASFAGSGSGLTNLDPANLAAGTAAIDVSGSAASITGTLGSSQLSGIYSNALTFSNASNSFTGDGSGLTGVTSSDPTKVAKTGDTMTGLLTLSPASGNALTANADINLVNGNLLKNGTLFLHDNSSNTGVGLSALLNNTSGSSNTAIGRDALRNNTTGLRNTAVGDNALEDNAGGVDNTAAGQQALTNNIGGGDNTAFGKEALKSNTSGVDNTAVGEEALEFSAGDGNIALGEDAGRNLTTGDDNIYIGNPGLSSESNTLRIGELIDDAFIDGIWGESVSVGTATAVMVDAFGKLGTTTSSRRYKTDIHDMGNVSSRLLELRPFAFTYKQHAASDGEAHEPGAEQYGLIAEEVEEIFPELVVYDAEDRPETVRYHLLSSLLLNELQKQQRLLEAQAQTLEQLKDRIQELSR